MTAPDGDQTLPRAYPTPTRDEARLLSRWESLKECKGPAPVLVYCCICRRWCNSNPSDRRRCVECQSKYDAAVALAAQIYQKHPSAPKGKRGQPREEE